MMIIYIKKSGECKGSLEMKERLLSLEHVKVKNFSDENQELVNQLQKLKSTLSELNAIMS